MGGFLILEKTINMKDETILDESVNFSPPQNKWKLASQAILILIIGLSITSLLQEILPTILTHYVSIIFALYFFIKRINYEDINLGVLFYWGTFIVFGAYLIFNTIHLLFFSDRITDSFLSFITFNLGSFLRSTILGNMLSFGVYHFIKSKSWSMLILMILTSWMFLTLLVVDPEIFGG
jgi:hypothetical protein